MADWRQFISIWTPPTTNGSVVFSLQTFDAAPNAAITITCTGSSGDDEITTATNFQLQIENALIANTFQSIDPQYPGVLATLSMLYGGVPKFSNEPFWPWFQLNRTDHIVCIWAQCQFRLSVVSNTLGCILDIGPSPVFCTYADTQNIAPIMGIDYVDNNENTLTSQQILYLIKNSSDQIAKLLNNNIVLATYLEELVGNRTGSVKLSVRPVLTNDIPQVRRPYIIGVTSVLITKSPVAYNLNRKLGILNYRFTNDLIDISEPFDTYNEIKISYIAGRLNIPTIIKEKTIQVSSEVMEDINVKVLRGGSFHVEFFQPIETLKWLITELREFKLD